MPLIQQKNLSVLMVGQFVKIGVRLLFALSLMYFVYSCYGDEQNVQIIPVTQPKQWTYDITTMPILGERMYEVLIDGELNGEATLNLQLHRTTGYTAWHQPGTTFLDSWTSPLPQGRFSLYYNRDDSGPEAFAYRPLTATKGWIRVQIHPGQWNWQDSSRAPLRSGSYRSYPTTITPYRAPIKFVFHP